MAGNYNFMHGMANSSLKKWFVGKLLSWNSTDNQREMPWKGEKNPYRVWMSEIILQQTRVEQGRAYYERFITQYPEVSSLAMAEDQSVFKLWEGLGYYSRCRNMLAAARRIHDKLDGKFPDKIEDIKALPGVGSYTAAAIASFAYDQPHAVLDGNVFRVLSRFFDIEEPIDTSAGKALFTKLSDALLPRTRSAEYNQAIMDFGATICKPRSPLCEECPLQEKCKALALGRTQQLPVKSRKAVRKDRFFNFLILSCSGKVPVEKRIGKDIWENLYQFPLVESQHVPNLGDWKIKPDENANCKKPAFLFQHVQQLSHQNIHGRFFALECKPVEIPEGMQWVKISELKTLPFPRMITRILADLTHDVPFAHCQFSEK